MSEIEKLYENAGIKPTYYDACTVEDKYWQDEELANKYGTFDMYMNAKCGNQENCSTLCSCAYTKEEYPPFTEKKQLELIKWLSKRKLLSIAFSEDKNTFQLFNEKCAGSFCEDLATSIATLVQCELDFCTEQEKDYIKEILNG